MGKGNKMNLYYIEWGGESYIVVAPSRESAIFTISEFISTFNPLDAKIGLGAENPHSFLITGRSIFDGTCPSCRREMKGDWQMVFFPDAAYDPETDKTAQELLDY